MINRFIKIFFYISQVRDKKYTYHKPATVNGKRGCVQANLSPAMAKKINALPGKCFDLNCLSYEGEYNIPLCCTLQCFTCEDYL